MIRINIDGQEIKAYEGQTILEAARANGISIPTLCYDQRVEIYGGCGLCVVETGDSPRLLRACSTEIAEGMIVATDSERVRASRRLTLELLFSDHSGDCRGPCTRACPAHADVQGYVGLIANRQYRLALELIKEKIPLPASIGRVCPHPCESSCRRQLVEAPLSIAALKAFAADRDLAGDDPYIPAVKASSGKRVAIVGAGPAGLAAAYQLARQGHGVTVYDAMPAGGGMLRYGIPEYRLPKAVLDQEIELIRRMGVEFRFNTRIGSDLSLDLLRRENDALFLGIGAWLSSEMRCPGEELPGVLGGIDFLREVALMGDVRLGPAVAVVGGGNTAMDAARTAVRLGCERVMVLYRRTRAEMPAEDLEIQEAEEEGVEFRFLVAPLEVIAENGRAHAIRLQKMRLGVPDASGRRSPVPIPGDEETVYVDSVISAIGQKVNPAGLEAIGLSKWGTIEIDEDTMATGIPGVFAGGDGVTGPKIAVDAIAQGGRAAQSIDNYLKGGLRPLEDEYTAEQKHLGPEDFADCPARPRADMPHLAAGMRRGNFLEVNQGLAAAEAEEEARRCLECGCQDYFTCRLLAAARSCDIHPERLDGARRQERLREQTLFMERNSEKCILCGLCARVCREAVGLDILGLVNRGFESLVAPEFRLPLTETPCISCGQCVAVCPTGALSERLPGAKNVPLSLTVSPSVCSFCSLGCRQAVHSHGGRVLKVRPETGGLLCTYGRFGFLGWTGQERLVRPLLRRQGRLVEVSWEEAWKDLGDQMKLVNAGPADYKSAVLLSPSSTLEEAREALQLGRQVLKNGRVAALAAHPAAGWPRLASGSPDQENPEAAVYQNRLEELAGTDMILLVGDWQQNPVAAMQVRRAARNGVRVAVISPRTTLVDELAACELVPENSLDLLREILAAIVAVSENTAAGPGNGASAAEPSAVGERSSLIAACRQALQGVEIHAEAQTVADMYISARRAMIVADSGSLTAGALELLEVIALCSGHCGSPRNGMIEVAPGSNLKGLAQLGIGANEELIDDIRSGKVESLFILNDDPVGGGLFSPEQLERMKLTVVITPFLTPTAAASRVVLPAAVPMEIGGTLVRCDGLVQSSAPVIEPPHGMNNQGLLQRLNTLLAPGLSLNMVPARQPLQTATRTAAPLQLPGDGPLFAAGPVTDPLRRSFLEMREQDRRYGEAGA